MGYSEIWKASLASSASNLVLLVILGCCSFLQWWEKLSLWCRGNCCCWCGHCPAAAGERSWWGQSLPVTTGSEPDCAVTIKTGILVFHTKMPPSTGSAWKSWKPRHSQRPAGLHRHLRDRSRRTKLKKILPSIILDIFNCKCKAAWSCCQCCDVGWAGARACGSRRLGKLRCWSWLGLKLAPHWAGTPSTAAGRSKAPPAWPRARPGILTKLFMNPG